VTSVADPGCLSRTLIFIHPGSRIQQQQQISQNQRLFYFEQVKKNMCANLQRIVILSTQKIVIKLKNMGLGFRIRDPDPQQWW
jgi:hypothetical protein